jgi:hypothetical protein
VQALIAIKKTALARPAPDFRGFLFSKLMTFTRAAR